MSYVLNMPGSVLEDLAYIAKITLITLICLSFAVMFNGKIVEGIILLSFSIQLILIWLLDSKFELPEELTNKFKFKKITRSNNIIKLIAQILLFIIGLWFLFRAITIIQHSLINYGFVKINFYYDIIIASIIGVILIIILLVITFKNSIKKKQLDIPKSAA